MRRKEEAEARRREEQEKAEAEEKKRVQQLEKLQNEGVGNTVSFLVQR